MAETARITIFGLESRHKQLDEMTSRGQAYGVLTSGIDLEVEFVAVGDFMHVLNCQRVTPPFYTIHYHPFHVCGSSMETIQKDDSMLRCFDCHEEMDVTYNGSAVANALGDGYIPAHYSPIQIARETRLSRFTHIPNNILDLTTRSATLQVTSLETLLDQLFHNVPSDVLAQLLRNVQKKVEQEILHATHLTSIASVGTQSLSPAVGRFTIQTEKYQQKYVMKVVASKDMALKEILIAREASTVPQLMQYIPLMYMNTPITYNGYSLIVMDDVRERIIHKDPFKKEAYQALGPMIQCISNSVVHRLYISSLFHTHLKHLADNPLLFDCFVPRHYDAETVQNILQQHGHNVRIDSSHNEAVAYLLACNEDEIIVHNDMRAVNWEGQSGQLLIDFGNVSRADRGGGIYRDIVRILLAEDDQRIFEQRYLERVVACYWKLRDVAEGFHQERNMSYEYANACAALYVEANRAMMIVCHTTAPRQQMREIERYLAIRAVAQREALRVMKQ